MYRSLCLGSIPKNASFAFASKQVYRSLSSAASSAANLQVQPKTVRLGWIGTGIMGQHMCGHLLKKGFDITVYNRTAAKCQPLVEKGAKVAPTPFDVAQNSDVVFTMVGYPHDVQEVVLGDKGVINGLGKGGIVIDMTTSSPSLAKTIFEQGKAKQVHSVDAPVTGGDIGARDAKLSIMIGGEKHVVDYVWPLFEAMGTNIQYMGVAGNGQHTKMVNQTLIAGAMVSTCEGLLYAYRAGLDPTRVIAAVSTGSGSSWSINNLGPKIVARNFEPGFYVEHFVKDMGLTLEEAARMNLSLPGLALAHQLYTAVKAQGFAKKGTQALMLALEQLNKQLPPSQNP